MKLTMIAVVSTAVFFGPGRGHAGYENGRHGWHEDGRKPSPALGFFVSADPNRQQKART